MMFRLAVKHWKQDLTNTELRLLLVATLIAALSMSMITTFTDRLTRTMSYRASELIAGDLTLQSQNPINNSLIQHAKEQGFDHSPALSFSTMAFANDQLQLTQIRAVSRNYPLKGSITVADTPFSKGSAVTNVPNLNEVWVEQRVLQALSLEPGDQLEIGDALFKVGKILVQDADRSGNFYSPFGSIIMRLEDVKKTAVLAPGSRVLHKHYLQAPTSKHDQILSDSQQTRAIETLAAWLKPKLNKDIKLSGAVSSESAMGTAVQRAQQYLGLASLIAVLLSGVAIAMTSRRYSERHHQTAALLRCLGAQQKDISRLFLIKLLMTGILAVCIGSLLGFLGHYILFWLMSSLIPNELLPARIEPILISMLAGLIVLMAFAFVPIKALKHVSPTEIFRRELSHKPTRFNAFYLITALCLAGLAYWLTGQMSLSIVFIIGLTVMTAIFGTLSGLTLLFLDKIKGRMPSAFNIGFKQLIRHKYYAVSQLTAFAFIFTAITLILVVRTDLFTRWQASIPQGTPNHFAINILPSTLEPFDQYLNERGIQGSNSYPIVRGRLIEINQIPVKQIVSKENQPNAVKRELNLTWSQTLETDSEVIQGSWWSDTIRDQVSIESQLAEKLSIKLNDELTFKIAGKLITAKVSSVRKVTWDNFKPNFYMVFKPGVLDGFHHTYLKSFYLETAQNTANSDVLIDLSRTFKAVSIIPVEQVIQQVRDILEQTTLAVEYILILVLFAGLILLFATLQSTLSVRRHEAAIYRTLGASAKYINRLVLYEYLWLALLAGSLAVIATEALSFSLYYYVFKTQWTPHFLLWIMTPITAAMIIVSSGWLASRPIIESSPNQLLREVN